MPRKKKPLTKRETLMRSARKGAEYLKKAATSGTAKKMARNLANFEMSGYGTSNEPMRGLGIGEYLKQREAKRKK